MKTARESQIRQAELDFPAAARMVERAARAIEKLEQEMENARADQVELSARISRTLRDAGMTIAANAQADVAPTWAWRAEAAIVSVAMHQTTVHVDDVLRKFRDKPAHPNAWGAVWTKAIRAGVIVPTGQVRPCLEDPAKRAHNYPVYASKLCP